MKKILLSLLITSSITANFVPTLKEAQKTVLSFKCVTDNLFDRHNKDKLSLHMRRFSRTIDQLNLFIDHVKAAYQKTGEDKYRIALVVLTKINIAAAEIYNTANKRYFFFITFGYALKRVIDKYEKKEFATQIKDNLLAIISLLETHELREMSKLVDMLNALIDTFPKEEKEMKAILYNIWCR